MSEDDSQDVTMSGGGVLGSPDSEFVLEVPSTPEGSVYI